MNTTYMAVVKQEGDGGSAGSRGFQASTVRKRVENVRRRAEA